MNTAVKIAFRNLLRHKRRTMLTGCIISVGLFIYICMDSVMSGFDRGSIDNMIHLSTAAVKVCTKEYDRNRESYPLDYAIKDIDAMERLLRTNDRISGIAPRTQFLGELSKDGAAVPVIGTVVDPVKDRDVFTLHEHVVGRYFSETHEHEIIIGKSLAEDLNAKAGDFITLYGITKYEGHNAEDFKIVGLLNTTDPGLNKSGVLITYAAANNFLELEGTVTELHIQLKRRVNFSDMLRDMAAVRALIEKGFPSMTTATFAELGAGVLEIIRQKRLWGACMTFVLLLIAGVGIVNSVLMSVYERIREIGIMRAMGFSPKDIKGMFMAEGLMIGFAGSLGGILLGIIGVSILTTAGWPLDKFYGNMHVDTTGFPVWGTIYGEWNPLLMALTFLFGMTVSFFAAIIPARKAAGMRVVEAVRFI